MRQLGVVQEQTVNMDEAQVTRELSRMMHLEGHAFYGTVCGAECPRAAVWAAKRLITRRALLAAGRVHQGSTPDMAATLRVTVEDLRAYYDGLSRADHAIMMKLMFQR